MFIYDGQEWIVDPPNYRIEQFYSSWLSPAGNLYSGGYYGVYRITSHSPPELILEHDEFISIKGLYGTSDNNIFAVGVEISNADGVHREENVVFHYDGTEWQQLPNIPQIPMFISDLWTDGEEVFFVGELIGDLPGYGMTTVIIHGE